MRKHALEGIVRSAKVWRLPRKANMSVLFFVSVLSLGSCYSERSNEELVESPDMTTNEVLDEFRSKVTSEVGVTVLSYSDEFARRTGLEILEEGQDSSAGLQALELRVEANDSYASIPYSCVLRLYADSHLEVDFPQDNMSGHVRAFSEKNFFIRRHMVDGRLSDEDITYIEMNRADYGGKAHLVLRSKSGELIHRRSIGYIEYYSEILPGLDYSQFSLSCANFRVFSDKSEDSEVEIWLKKKSTENYFDTFNELKESDYVVFQFHREFVEKAATILRDTYENYIR
jgi:hypothetical protein